MTRKFKLKKGELVFYRDKIVIKDDSKKRHTKISYIVFSVMICGFYMFFNSFEKGGYSVMIYLIICIISFLILIWLMLRSVKSEISLSEVKALKVKHGFDGKILDIKIANNMVRRVTGIENTEELINYIETNIGTKSN